MTALGHHYSVYYRKLLVRLWYMLNRTLKTNVEPRWPLKSNLELRWPPFVCHVIWAVFATRNARTFVRSEGSEPFVRRTSRMKKRAYERILKFGTAQSNTPNHLAWNIHPPGMELRRCNTKSYPIIWSANVSKTAMFLMARRFWICYISSDVILV